MKVGVIIGLASASEHLLKATNHKTFSVNDVSSIGQADRHLIPAAFAVAGFLLMLTVTAPYGLGTTPDSAAFVSTARSLLEGNGFLHYGGSRLSLWPPTYPLMLALPGLLGFDPLDASRFIQAFLYGMLLFIGIRWIHICVRHVLLRLLLSLSAVFSAPLFIIGSHLWTDALFSFFFASFPILWARHYPAVKLRDTILLGLCAGMAFGTRYIGLSLCIAGFVLLAIRPVEWRCRLKGLVLFTALSGSITGPWVLRNFLIVGSLTGPRTAPGRGWLENLSDSLEIMGSWIIPVPGPSFLLTAAGATTLTLILFASNRRPSGYKASFGSFQDSFAILLCCALYLGTLLIAAHFTHIDKLDQRLLSPLFIPILVLFGMILDDLFRLRILRQGVLSKVCTAVLVLWVGANGIRFAHQVQWAYRHGANTTAIGRMKDSQTAEFLQGYKPNILIFSNDPALVYLLTGREAHWLPRRNTPLGIYSASLRKREVVVVWFNRDAPGTLHSPRTLSQQKDIRLERLADLEDGRVYQVIRLLPGQSS